MESKYEYEMSRCFRCSNCKFIPWAAVKSQRFSQVCPSAAYHDFHAYSCSGRMSTALSLYQGRTKEWSGRVQDIVYACQMCGGCYVSCNVNNYLLDIPPILEGLRITAVEKGEMPLELLELKDNLAAEDNPFGEPKSDRASWASGLEIKGLEEGGDVLLHLGCRLSYDRELWPVARAWARLFLEAGVDLCYAGEEEACCGGRAFEMGFKGELDKYADDMAARVRSSGARVLVTPCSDGYGTFKQTYPLNGHPLQGIRILHATELLERLIADGRIKPRERDLKVTYHDPCHLGRKAEATEPWNGKWELVGPHMYLPVPEKPRRVGAGGVYEAPRNILGSIPGLQLVEMERMRSYTWCCGAGGGVYETDPAFARWTALERIEEARSTGAEALVTACPWCERNFKDALAEEGAPFPIYDIAQLLVEED